MKKMSALTVLYLILPLSIAFLLHAAEELATRHKWMLEHREMLAIRFPKCKTWIEHLSQWNTKAHAIAALEEFLMIFLITFYVLEEGPWSVEIWLSIFIAFSLHLLMRICQAIILRGYVPGVVTSILLLPYVFIGMQMIWNRMSGAEIMLLSLIGVAVAVINAWLAYKLGIRITNNK